jgi:ABC-type amino acid transport system permease subunit
MFAIVWLIAAAVFFVLRTSNPNYDFNKFLIGSGATAVLAILGTPFIVQIILFFYISYTVNDFIKYIKEKTNKNDNQV